ncbi:MAG: hypothetical protein JNM93_09410 [Bacteriovoracaceae bacterium]|nr:hypothetical protein [Bacteriovoracaceae bacterium]
MKFTLILLQFFFVSAHAEINLFVHTYIYCGKEAKAKQALLFNALSKPDLCPAGHVPYPTTHSTCQESNELVDRCSKPIECSASFACRVSDEIINTRELIRRVMRNEPLELYSVKAPEMDIPEEKVFEVEVQAPTPKTEEKAEAIVVPPTATAPIPEPGPLE